MAGNEYIEETKSKKKEKQKVTKKTKKNTRSVKIDLLKPVKNWFGPENRKFNLSFGLILLGSSLYIVLAILSYLFTWKADQSLVMHSDFFSFIFNKDVLEIENHLGKLGAWTSHLFIYRWFGISSLFIPFMMTLMGMFLSLRYKLFPLRKTIGRAIIGMITISILLGFFTKPEGFPIGGNFGYQINVWLKLVLGSFGTLLFLIITISVVIIGMFNPKLDQLLSFFNLKSKEESTPQVETEKHVNDFVAINTISDEEIEEDAVSNTIDLSGEEEKEEEETSDLTDENELEIENLHELTDEESEDGEILSEENENTQEELEIEIKDDEVLSDDEINSKVKEFGEYDPKLDLASYCLPTLDLLEPYGKNQVNIDKEELESNKNRIVEALGHYKIEISKIKATVGPTVTLYEIVPAPGIRISKIKNLADDIALSLAANGIRIIAPIPGRGTIGIEVPNSKPEMVSMRSMIASEKFQNTDMELPIVMGKTISNETFVFDLAKAPHLLCAGATGQGKSVGLNAILVSILYKKHPSQVKFVMVDPKKVELTLYNKIERHFLAKLPDAEEAIITDTSKVVNTMNSLCIEMDERYELLKDAQVRNIKEYNKKFINRRLNPEKGHRYLPYIVVVIDEFADLIMTAGKEIEHPIARLAQLARAIGIHLIVATQRPSVNVITGMIKANFPARIAFRVSSGIDSKTILDQMGAEQLIGRGDMLVSFGNDLTRLQCAFVDTPEVENICDFIGDQRAYPEALLLPEYVGEEGDGPSDIDLDERDSLFDEAAKIIVTHQQGSASLLQRKLKIGYNRAGRLIDQLEVAGIIGPFKGSKAREVLIVDLVELDQKLSNFN